MKRILTLILITTAVISCHRNREEKEQVANEENKLTEIITENFELYKPTNGVKAVLILFGGYPENAVDIKRQFPIRDMSIESGIAVLFSNYNQKLWLEEGDNQELAQKLQHVIVANQLPVDNIFIGGFSSGGIVSLLLSNYITGMKQFYIDPKGVFIVDSPIDLVALYNSSKKNIERNFSEPSIQESTWLLEKLGNRFGTPKENIEKYEQYAVYTYSTDNISNLTRLKRTKIRLYTEPDTLWWKENRMADYEQMNAFYIKKLSESLIEKGYERVEYISTFNKGYRANGERHPHSWAIVDKEDLIHWMLKE